MRAMLLAAGLGTRLRPLTDQLPKPAVPLLDRPLGHYAIDRLLAAGVTSLAANAHHLPLDVERVVCERLPHACVAVEPILLGQARERDGEPIHRDEAFVVSNADVLFAVDLAAALAAHVRAGAYATMVVRRDPRADRLGPIDVDAHGRVRRILGVPDGREDTLTRTMFTGMSILSGRAVLDLPASGCLVRQGYRRWLDRGEHVHAILDSAAFRDLGTPGDYLQAHVDLLTGAVPWVGVTPGPRWVHPSADVGRGAVLEQTAVGAGARIAPGVVLERVVVWPQTVVREADRGVILHPSGRLVAS